MTSYNSLNIKNKNGVKTKMKKTINLYGKRIEIVFWCMFCVWFCFLLIENCCCMCCCGWCMLYHIWVSWINYDNTIKVWKPSMVIKISICHLLWRGKRCKTFFCTCVVFSKIIVVMVSQRVSWVVVCSFSHGHWNKWIPKSLMLCPHWQYEICVTIGYGKPS
jgi:hypothetical protein